MTVISICRMCKRRRVPPARECYAVPTCYVCLPPPEPLPVRPMRRRGA